MVRNVVSTTRGVVSRSLNDDPFLECGRAFVVQRDWFPTMVQFFQDFVHHHIEEIESSSRSRAMYCCQVETILRMIVYNTDSIWTQCQDACRQFVRCLLSDVLSSQKSTWIQSHVALVISTVESLGQSIERFSQVSSTFLLTDNPGECFSILLPLLKHPEEDHEWGTDVQELVEKCLHLSLQLLVQHDQDRISEETAQELVRPVMHFIEAQIQLSKAGSDSHIRAVHLLSSLFQQLPVVCELFVHSEKYIDLLLAVWNPLFIVESEHHHDESATAVDDSGTEGYLYGLISNLVVCFQKIASTHEKGCERLGNQVQMIEQVVHCITQPQNFPCSKPSEQIVVQLHPASFPWKLTLYEEPNMAKVESHVINYEANLALLLSQLAKGMFIFDGPAAPAIKSKQESGKKEKDSKQQTPQQPCENTNRAVLQHGFTLVQHLERTLRQEEENAQAVRNTELCVELLRCFQFLSKSSFGREQFLEQITSHQMKNASDDAKEEETETSSEWPLSVEKIRTLPHATLLHLISYFLHDSTWSFECIESALNWFASLIDQQASTVKEEEEHGKDTHMSISDIFINTSTAMGYLVQFIAVHRQILDQSTATKEHDGKRLNEFLDQLKALIVRMVNLGYEKDQLAEQALALQKAELADATPVADDPQAEDVEKEKNHDLVEEEPAITIKQKAWAKALLNERFDIPRYGLRQYTALHAAIQMNLPSFVPILLTTQVNVDIKNDRGETPLMTALLCNSSARLVEELLQAGADVNEVADEPMGHMTVLKYGFHSILNCDGKGFIGTTPGAIQVSSPLHLPLLLHYGSDVNISDQHGNFPLHLCVSESTLFTPAYASADPPLGCRYQSDMDSSEQVMKNAQSLLAHGANGNACNHLGQTALHLALLYGHSKVAHVLLDHDSGINPNIRDRFGALPLHYACAGLCPDSLSLVQKLIDVGTKYPLLQGEHQDIRKGKTTREKKLIEIHAILDAGWHAITAPPAIINRKASVPELFSTPTTGECGLLPLHYIAGATEVCGFPYQGMAEHSDAIRSARVQILNLVEQLVGSAYLQQLTRHRFSIAHYAVQGSVNAPLLDALLSKVVDRVSLENQEQESLDQVHDLFPITSLANLPTGSHVRRITNQHHERGLIWDYSWSSQRYTVWFPQRQVLEQDVLRSNLEPCGPSLDGPFRKHFLNHEHGFTPLHYALVCGNFSGVLTLIKSGANLQPEIADIPLLPLACFVKSPVSILRHLAGPQVNVRASIDTMDGTALHFAVLQRQVRALELLVSLPVTSVDIKRKSDGCTALHLACNDEPEIRLIEILVRAGSSLLVLNDAQETPLGQIVASRHENLRPLLETLVESNVMTRRDLIQQVYSVPESKLIPSAFELVQLWNMEITAQEPSPAQRVMLSHSIDLLEYCFTLVHSDTGGDDDHPPLYVHECFEMQKTYGAYLLKTFSNPVEEEKPETSVKGSPVIDDNDDAMTEEVSPPEPILV